MAQADALRDRIAVLRTDLEQALEALEVASSHLAELAHGAASPHPGPEGSSRTQRAAAGGSSRSAGRAKRPRTRAAAQADTADEAMLRATKMAVAGVDRKAIEAKLKQEFGVLDAAPILDRVLGPGR